MQWTAAYWAALVGILGTTISPYLFFWQAAEEVEEEISAGKRTLEQREGASNRELRRSRNDVLTGIFFSNLVMYFIILTSAATLHAHARLRSPPRAMPPKRCGLRRVTARTGYSARV
jgi:Mn2+/Fe2+ NRAMP family transporter